MDKGTITRTVLLAVALINQFLVVNGLTPISEDAVGEFVTYAFTAFTAVWAWWKNNDVTRKARENKKTLEKLKKK